VSRSGRQSNSVPVAHILHLIFVNGQSSDLASVT
jgi:hypothetical protein